jgi:hypothetical protein
LLAKIGVYLENCVQRKLRTLAIKSQSKGISIIDRYQ